MTPLVQLLEDNWREIKPRLHLGYVRKKDLVHRLEKWEDAASGEFGDEQVWTYLAACGYAIAGTDGVARLARILTGADLHQPDDSKIWLEVLPLPPRRNEGTTHLDLALGAIARREKTKSGIELNYRSAPWICFCEMKWNSDISLNVAHDPHRNQLDRVIENALCFQGKGRYADETYVALVTPAIYKDAQKNPREYQRKFGEYDNDKAKLLKDLTLCALEKRASKNWRYPDEIAQRIEGFQLRWPTYEDLFTGIPESTISEGLQRFWEECGPQRSWS